MIEILTKAAGIVGLIMVGAMTSNTVIFKTVIEFKMKGQSLMNVQSALDSIFKGIVPLLMTFGCYKLLNITGGRFEYNEMQSILYVKNQEWNL